MSELRLEAIGLVDRKPVVADVVFVHGLGGSKDTWRFGGDDSTSWPFWLFEELPNIKVWILEYPAEKFQWTGTGGVMALPDRAKAIIDLLVNNEIGSRPVVFIAHSLGGLLVKQILRIACEMNIPDWKELAANTRGVLFLATPHNGSGIGSLAKAVSVLIGASATTVQLAANDPHLRELNEWYQQNALPKGFNTRAYFETLPLGPAIIVDQGSANPGVQGCVPIPFDGNHSKICKPTSKTDTIYLGAKKFVEFIVGEPVDQLGNEVVLPNDNEVVAGLTQEPIDDFEFFTTPIDEDDRLDLAEKLTLGGREREIARALILKEQFAKRFTRNQLQPAATRHYIKVLAEIESRFNAHVYPEILDGKSKAHIADLIRSKITEPILAARPSDDLINAVVIDRMIYYLTGVCHIRWSP